MSFSLERFEELLVTDPSAALALLDEAVMNDILVFPYGTDRYYLINPSSRLCRMIEDKDLLKQIEDHHALVLRQDHCLACFLYAGDPCDPRAFPYATVRAMIREMASTPFEDFYALLVERTLEAFQPGSYQITSPQ